MTKSLFQRIAGRFLHLLARHGPGSRSLRPWLHRLRGVQLGEDVFIGDEVYLENEYPEAVEIQDGVQISVRAVILAHTRGPGKVVIEKNAFIGPHTVIVASGGRVVRIGEGAVIGAGVVVTNDVAPHLLITTAPPQLVAKATVPLSTASTFEEFIRGLVPVREGPLASRERPALKAVVPGS